MENIKDNFHHLSPEQFKDEKFTAAVEHFPHGVLVYITTTRQVQMAEEVRATADGPRIKVSRIGSVPIDDLRLATKADIEKAGFSDDVEEINGCYFFKK